MERLTIDSMDEDHYDYYKQLARDMLSHMPNLNELVSTDVCPQRVPELLSASRNGWKMVEFTGKTLPVSSTAQAVLEKRFSTLEVLHVSGSFWEVRAHYWVRVLSSCPNLRVLIDHDTNIYRGIWPHLCAQVFVDQDPVTGLFRAWACEPSLKVLKIDTPRLELGRKEDFGAPREAHGLVYDRLARLTNLETLWLGNWSYSTSEPIRHQRNCLEMTLESGLHKLASLRKLEELSVIGTRTRLGIEEVRWMTEHWPRLRVIYGLDDQGYNEDAIEWLREHHPKIRVQSL